MGYYVKIGHRSVWHEGRQPEFASMGRARPIDVRRAADAARAAHAARPRTLAEMRAQLEETNNALIEHERRMFEREFARVNAGPVRPTESDQKRRERLERNNGACSSLPFMASKLG
jgi:hypothetical protein